MTAAWACGGRRWTLGAALLLAACSAGPSTGLLTGPVDPERVADLAVEPVGAASCTLRKRASLPVSLPGLPVVPAQINGHPATLVLDTGAESSILSEAAAKRLGVGGSYDFVRTMRGIGATVRTGDAKLQSMSLGSVALTFPRILVGNVVFNLGATEADGLLGASLLADFDLDLDLPHRRLDLYDRQDCAGARPAWSGAYAAVTTTRSLSNHPFFPIVINGQRLTATLDSGAQRTVIAAAAASRAGIDAGSQIAGPEIRTRGAAGETMPATLHAVRNASVGGVPIRGPILVAPATLPRDIDALIGADFLAANRVWLSYGARRIFIQEP